MSHIYARVTGTGGYVPERILTNEELAKTVDTSDEWIVERTGIRQRHIAADDENASDLAVVAAQRAMKMAGINIENVDLIVLATSTADHTFPSAACVVQRKLGMNNGVAFDVQAACSGFVFALDVAKTYIENGSARRAIVIGTEVFSRILDWNDRATCVLFGDGAGAVVLEASDQPGIHTSIIRSDGDFIDLLLAEKGAGNADPAANPKVTMRGNEVFRKAVTQLGDLVGNTLEKANMNAEQLDWLVPHQANLRIISATAKKLNMSMERVILTVGDHGNTSAASIPLALDVGIRNGKIEPGQTVLMEAFGGGFTWGSALMTY